MLIIIDIILKIGEIMNIFILDQNIKKIAEYHADKHVVKMILETAQIMSAVVRYSGIDAGYKITHINHPCTKWARASLSNWMWLYDLGFWLNIEYRYRFNHNYNHKSFDVIDNLPEPNIEDIGITPFAQAMPTECKNEDAVTAYRNYYNQEKRHLFKWTKRDVPYWINAG